MKSDLDALSRRFDWDISKSFRCYLHCTDFNGFKRIQICLIIVSSLFHRPLCAQWLQALEIYVSTPNHNALHRHPGHSLKIVLAQDGCGRSSFRGDQAWDAVFFASPGKMSPISIDSPFKKMFVLTSWKWNQLPCRRRIKRLDLSRVNSSCARTECLESRKHPSTVPGKHLWKMCRCDPMCTS